MDIIRLRKSILVSFIASKPPKDELRGELGEATALWGVVGIELGVFVEAGVLPHKFGTVVSCVLPTDVLEGLLYCLESLALSTGS